AGGGLGGVGGPARHRVCEHARAAPEMHPVRRLRRVRGDQQRVTIDVALEVVHLPQRHAVSAGGDVRESGAESGDLSIVTHLVWCYARAPVDTGWEESMEEMVARCGPDRNRR